MVIVCRVATHESRLTSTSSSSMHQRHHHSPRRIHQQQWLWQMMMTIIMTLFVVSMTTAVTATTATAEAVTARTTTSNIILAPSFDGITINNTSNAFIMDHHHMLMAAETYDIPNTYRLTSKAADAAVAATTSPPGTIGGDTLTCSFAVNTTDPCIISDQTIMVSALFALGWLSEVISMCVLSNVCVV
jgi:hypothetical protein